MPKVDKPPINWNAAKLRPARPVDPPGANGVASVQPKRPTLPGEVFVDPQRRLTSVVRDVTQQLASCFETIRSLQRSLIDSLQEYVGVNIAGIPPFQACMDFLRSSDPLLSSDGLRGLCISCDQILSDCERITSMLQDYDEIRKEYQHYQKISVMLNSQARNSDLCAKNSEKLLRAKQVAEERQLECEAEVKAFNERCTLRSRATLYALLHNYIRMVGDWALPADVVAKAFDGELKSGSSVKVVGIQETPDDPEALVTIEGFQNNRRSCTLNTPDGPTKAVRAVDICPLSVIDQLKRTPVVGEPMLAAQAGDASKFMCQESCVSSPLCCSGISESNLCVRNKSPRT